MKKTISRMTGPATASATFPYVTPYLRESGRGGAGVGGSQSLFRQSVCGGVNGLGRRGPPPRATHGKANAKRRKSSPLYIASAPKITMRLSRSVVSPPRPDGGAARTHQTPGIHPNTDRAKGRERIPVPTSSLKSRTKAENHVAFRSGATLFFSQSSAPPSTAAAC